MSHSTLFVDGDDGKEEEKNHIETGDSTYVHRTQIVKFGNFGFV